MTPFFRFPHTPHLAWLGTGQPRDDKVLSPPEAASLLAGEVVVEEKIDGANLGFSTTEHGDVQVQNRGSYLDCEHAHPQFRPLWSWLAAREAALVDALWPHLVLFGEWCFAVHSVAYDQLPDWFLGFDVYDRDTESFWDTSRRDGLLEQLRLPPVPRLGKSHFSLGGLERLLQETSRVGRAPLEGVIVRAQTGGITTARAKLVRAEFTQAIEEHWSRGPLRQNRLAEGVTSWPSPHSPAQGATSSPQSCR